MKKWKHINFEQRKTISNTPIKSLDSNTPKDAFITVFDEDLFNKLFK